MKRFPVNPSPITPVWGIALSLLLAFGAMPQNAAPKVPAQQVPAPQGSVAQTPAGEIVLRVDPAQSSIHWTLGSTLHTVHGTFEVKGGTVHVDPANGKASGEIIADATSGKSGDDSRDHKMHKDVLESEKYPDVIFRPDRVEGKIAREGNSSVQVHGVFVLHGREHEITIPVQAELAGDRWSGNAKFSEPFIDWGLKNPSNFLLRVSHTVDVGLQLKGSLQSPAG